MDDTTQTQQPSVSPAGDAISNMNDVAGMTPPPAPVMPATDQAASAAPSMPAANPMSAPTAPAAEGDEDYSYAEDVLNEILDGLDRIEAKLEAIEKKLG